MPVWQPASAETLALYQQMLTANHLGGTSGGGFSMAQSTMPPYPAAAPWGASYGVNPNMNPATNSFMPGYASGNQVVYAHYAGAQASAGQVQTTTPATTSAPATPVAPAAPAAPAAAPAEPKPETKKKPTTTKTEPKAEPKKAEPKAEPKPERKTVTVKSGDSLSKIAAAHGVSWQKLYELNKGVVGGNPNLIRPGQVLKLPA